MTSYGGLVTSAAASGCGRSPTSPAARTIGTYSAASISGSSLSADSRRASS